MSRTSAPQSGGLHRSPGSDARERILSAAASCFGRIGVAATRMEDIADEAGMQRPHLYRHFAGKDDIVRQVIVDEVRRRGRDLRSRISLRGPVGPLLLESIVSGLELSAADWVTQYMVSPEAAHDVQRIIAAPGGVVDSGWDYWGPLVAYGRGRGEIRDDLDDDEIVRWLVSLTFMLLQNPGLFAGFGGPGRYVEQFVIPAVLKHPVEPHADRHGPTGRSGRGGADANRRRRQEK
jgi:AcrR family transcriptional regulator